LLPETSFARRKELVRHELQFLNDRVKRIQKPNERWDVKEYPNAIIVSDLSLRQSEDIHYHVNWAISHVATYLRHPSKMPTSDGKPIVIVLSTPTMAIRFNVEDVESDLSNYLSDQSVKERPLLIVETEQKCDRKFLNGLYRKTTTRFLARVHSNKPLPAWIQVGLVQLHSPANPKSGRGEIAARVRIPGNYRRTVTTDDVTQVDNVIALELLRQLQFVNPIGLTEVLFDLKHGQPIEPAIVKHLDTTLDLQLMGFAQTAGVNFDIDDWSIKPQ
jgi:hypothetical protein